MKVSPSHPSEPAHFTTVWFAAPYPNKFRGKWGAVKIPENDVMVTVNQLLEEDSGYPSFKDEPL